MFVNLTYFQKSTKLFGAAGLYTYSMNYHFIDFMVRKAAIFVFCHNKYKVLRTEHYAVTLDKRFIVFGKNNNYTA